jgi:PhnB protein
MPQQEPRGLVPHLVVDGAAKAIDFYKKAFGAEEVMRMPDEDGKRLMHAHIVIGDAHVMLADDYPERCGGKARTPTSLGGTPITLHQNVPNCDAAIKRCADAGAEITMPAQDMFWGDRYGQITDPFGHVWSFSTPLKK